MAKTTLKFAKKAGADAQAKNKDVDNTRINFMIVTGGTSSKFKAVHDAVYHKQDNDKFQEFLLRYDPIRQKNWMIFSRPFVIKMGQI